MSAKPLSSAPPIAGLYFAWREPMQMVSSGQELTIQSAAESLRFPSLWPPVVRAVREVTTQPTAVSLLIDGLQPREVRQFHLVMQRCESLIERSLVIDNEVLLQVALVGRAPEPQPRALRAKDRVRLSKFALLRARSGSLVLESPLARARITLVHPGLLELVQQLTGELSVPAAGEMLAGQLSSAQGLGALQFLVDRGFLDYAGARTAFTEELDPALAQWEFHDLLFHSRSRVGRYDDPIGGSFVHRGRFTQEPAIKIVPPGPEIILPRPNLSDILDQDPPLTVVLEARRSLREYGQAPMGLPEVGEFLYRVARNRVRWTSADPAEMQMVGRPYPAGGSAYELELYLNVRRCTGLASGIYYYDPVRHALILINDQPADLSAMFAVAQRSTDGSPAADILVTTTARMARLSWKYQGIAYAIALRHTGVLYQTMYLVATAMRLAPCGLGVGDAELAARVLKLDYLRESAVGEFLIGSRSQTAPPDWSQTPGWELLNDAHWALRSAEILAAEPPVPAPDCAGTSSAS